MGRHRKQPERKPIPLLPAAGILTGAFIALASAPVATNSGAEFSAGTVKAVVLQQPKPMLPPKPKSPPVPLIGAAGLTWSARQVADYVSVTYPAVRVIGGVRPDRLPDHPSGHAVDIMVDNNTALGNAIYTDLRGQQGKFGIRYMLWQVAQHYDHVHVTVF